MSPTAKFRNQHLQTIANAKSPTSPRIQYHNGTNITITFSISNDISVFSIFHSQFLLPISFVCFQLKLSFPIDIVSNVCFQATIFRPARFICSLKISEKALKMIPIQPKCTYLDSILSIHKLRSSSTDMSYQLFEPDNPFLQKWCNIDNDDSTLIHT